MAASGNQDKDFLDIDLDEPIEDIEDMSDSVVAKAAPAPTLGDGILLFDNKRYAVSLSWLIAEDEGDASLAVRRAKDFKADFYCLRQGVANQHGFGFLEKGHRIGAQALAAIAADTLVGEWHGVFVADNGWWYVAVHADNIAPEGDILFASEEAAYNHFLAQNAAFRWPRSYSPESWNVPETSGDIPLSKVIGDANAPALKPVTLDAIFSGRRNKNLAFVAMAAIIGLIVLSLIGQQVLPSLIPQQAQIPSPDIQVSDTLQTPPKEPEIVREEQGESLIRMKLPLPSAQIAACIDGFASISIALPGWQLSMLKCKETFVEGTWARRIGSFETVEPFLQNFPEGVQRGFPDARTLVVTRRLPGLKNADVPRELFERNRAIISLTKRFGEIGDFNIKEIIPVASQQLLQGIEMMQQPGFNMGQNKIEIRPLGRDDLPHLAFTLQTQTPPNMMAAYFDIPGVLLQSVQDTVPSGEWVYEGKMILRPDKRLIEANTKAKALAKAAIK